MPTLPTPEEWRRSEQERLERLWEEIGSTKGLAAFFDEIELTLQARLDAQFRIRIAQGMARFCRNVASALEPDTVRAAKRLVDQARKRTAKLRWLTENYQNQLSKAKDGARSKLSAQAGRECWAAYEDLEQCVEKLDTLAGDPPGKRLSAVTSSMRQALMEVGTPFLYNDYSEALRILDELLDNWSGVSHARERQASAGQALSDLLVCTAEGFQEATGRALGSAERFRPFLQCILKALPGSTRPHHGVQEGDKAGLLPKALQKRLGRDLRKAPHATR